MGFDLKWKTLPRFVSCWHPVRSHLGCRIISSNLAQMLHIPVGLQRREEWNNTEAETVMRFMETSRLSLIFMRLRSSSVRLSTTTGEINVAFPREGFPWFEAVGQNFVEYNYSDTEGSIGTMTDVSGIDDSDIEDVLDLPKSEP